MRSLNISKTADQLTAFIKTTVTSAGFSDVVIAVSGGIDSATSLSLAAKALGTAHVHALLLPYKDWHTEAIAHAQLTRNSLQIPATRVHEINIEPMVEAFSLQLLAVSSTVENKPLKATSSNPQKGPSGLQAADNVRLGNIMARTRMITLFDFAKANNCLVVGTENKSEHYLGYYTRFGDEASDIEPIRNLYKTEIFQLAKYLNVPKEILEKAPTAGLWAGQTDEGQFGFSYKDADEIIYQLCELKKTVSEIEKQGIGMDVIQKVKTWVESVSFKHHLPHLPPEPIIGSSI